MALQVDAIPAHVEPVLRDDTLFLLRFYISSWEGMLCWSGGFHSRACL